MKVEKSVKEFSKKVFISVLVALTLFSTSTLTAVLTQQKALQAAQLPKLPTEQPYDNLLLQDEIDPDVGKTDRFIVKYKENKAESFKSKLTYTLASSNGIDSVRNSLETSDVLPNSKNSQNVNNSRSSALRYSDIEVLILSEKVFPSEFEESLIASGAYNDIIYIQPDYEMEIASLDIGTTTTSGLNTNPPSNSSIASITVAVIDTGVDPNHTAYASYLHPLTPNVYDSSNPLAFAHGTHIAGIIAGEAYQYGVNIQILVLPVFSQGYAYTSDILAAIETAELLGASVVNCSFGNASYNQALYEAMETSSMLFVCATGNGREDLQLKPVYPACFGLDNVISVGSVNADMGYSYFSNYNGVDIAAIGREVTSAIPGGGYGSMTGTSMAAARVTGATAVILANNNTLNSNDLATRILYSADKYTHLYNKVTSGRYLNTDNALAGIQGSTLTVQYEDDFDVHGYAPTPEENFELFSSLTVVQVAAGLSHTLALMSDGTVWAWGNNNYGQLGNGITSYSELLVQVVGLNNITAIAAGESHNLALKTDGTVWAWGYNNWGQLGNGVASYYPIPTPIQVSGLTNVTAITAGHYHSLAVKSEGTVWAWGWNGYLQLGGSTTGTCTTPVQVNGLADIISVAAGYGHSIALKSNGTAWAWGRGDFGQLGRGSTYDSGTPMQISNLSGVVSIVAGLEHSLAVKSDGTVWAWGSNSYGQIGDGTKTNRTIPVQVSNITGVESVTAGQYHSLALKLDGTVWNWGQNSYGQLGDGTTIERTTPVLVNGLSGIAEITSGYSYSLALKANGAIWSWGRNNFGQLGDGITIIRAIPAQTNLTGVMDVAVGQYHSLALKSDGTVWAWGNNSSGQLGNGTRTDSSTPVKVNNLTGVVAIATESYYSLALKSDGTVWAWGNNSSGQLGDGTTTQRLVPVQVSGLTGVVDISAGYNHGLAVKSDGTVWGWGSNGYGQLGDGTTTQKLVPVQVSNLAGVTAIDAGYMHSLAIKSDGTVWAWGNNDYGQLGDSTTTQRITPVQINGLTSVDSITAGYMHSLAIKSDGTIWAWGQDEHSQLGLGRLVQTSVPIQSFANMVQLVFDQSSYALTIPKSGSPNETVTISVTVIDAFGGQIAVPITYGLDDIYAGVSINSATGIVTVDSTASVGNVGLTATYSGLVATATLVLASFSDSDGLVLNVTEGNLYTVSTWANEIEDFSGMTFVLTYDDLMLEVDTLSALVWEKVLDIGEISGTGITIISFEAGEIVFLVNQDIPFDMVWNGITNAFRFKALDDGEITITLSEASGGGRGDSLGTSEGRAFSSYSMTLSAVSSTIPKRNISYLNSRSLQSDERAKELLSNLSDFNNFSEGDKQYIQDYLGLSRPLTEEELYFIAKWEKEQAERKNSIAPEVILFDLLEGRITFDTISDEDWATIEKFFGNLSSVQLEALIAKGTSAKDILQISIAMKTGMFDVAEAEQLLVLYPDDTERVTLVFDLFVCTIGSEPSVYQAAKTMILSGNSLSTVQKTLTLNDNVVRIAINVETDEIRINGSSGSYPSRGGTQNTDFDPVAPFSVNNGSDESIDLNSGNLKYSQNIMNLPGINDFDLNLALVYNSSDSTLYQEDWDCVYYAVLWSVPYQDYCYRNEYLYQVGNLEFEYFCDYFDALDYINTYNNGVLIDYEEGWEAFPYPFSTSNYWLNELLLVICWDYGGDFNDVLGDPWAYGNEWAIIYEDPAPNYLYVEYEGILEIGSIEEYIRFSGYIPYVSGPDLLYYYCDGDPWHAYWNWCYEFYMTWLTYYSGSIYGDVYSVYETVRYSGSAVYQEDWDCDYFNTTYNRVESNGLGAGWSWNLPSINADGNNSTLNLGNGQSYTIGAYNSSTKTYALKNYSLQDLVLKQTNSYNNGQYTSYYVLEYKNGDKAYFNNKGLLMAQVDRYGNTITYKYSSFSGNQVLSQIIDSAGRTINLVYANTSNGRTVTITAPDGAQTVITMDKISGHMTHYALTKITDPIGNQTQFNYTTSSGAFNLFAEDYVSPSNNYWALLTEVTYPTSAKKVFSYTKYTDNFGSYGYRQFYRVTARKDIVDWTDYNLKTYSYSGSSNGNGTYDPNDLPSGYTYSATITDGNDPQNILTTTYIFDNKHLSISETIKNNNATVATTTYDYNADKLPTTITSHTYNSSGNYMETILLYEYDNKGNVTAFWNEQANGNKAKTDFKTTYVYDTSVGNYNQLLSKTYRQDSFTTITENYTLTVDKRAVSTAEILVNSVLKSKKQYGYDSKGQVTSEKALKDDFINYVETTYTYDSAGNLTGIINSGVKDVDGNLVTGTPGINSAMGRLAVTFVYNSVGELTSYTDALGNTTTYQYDLLGRIINVTHADNTCQTMTYDDVNNILTVTDEIGTKMKYYYDGFGNLLRVYDVTAGQYLTTNTYDAKMRLATSNNHNNSADSAQTTYTYDYLSRVISQQTKDNNNNIIAWQTSSYDDAADNGQYQKVTHTVEGDAYAASVVSSIYFNKYGFLEKQSRTLGNTEFFDYFTYDYVGNLISEKTAIAVQNYNQVPYTVKYEYDFANRVIMQYNVAGDYTSFEYDTLGRLVCSTDYAANASFAPYSTTYVYDDMGRLLQESIPMEKNSGIVHYSVNKYYYDANSNIVKEQFLTNLPGQAPSYATTEYQYNNRDLPIMTIQYDGVTAYYANYSYYNNGLMESTTAGNGASTFIYIYDYAGRLIEFTDALGNSETFVYDTNGNLLTKTDRNGWITTYTYDGLGRIISTTVSTGNPSTDCEQHFTYTLAGFLLSEDNGDFAAIYTYDELGRLVSVSESNNVVKTYTYDIADNRLSYVLEADNVILINTSYVYDHFNRLEIVEENGLTVAVYTYDVNGNRDSLIYANGTSEYYTYNLANMVTSLINKEGSTVISSYSYTYYLDGNQHTKTDHTGLVTTYEYDGMGRLVLEEETLLNIVQQSWTYTYDTSHNRIMMVTYSPSMTFVTDYTYDLNNRLLTEARATGNGWAITNYSYDNNGNQIVKYYQELQYIPLGGTSPSIGLSAGQEGFDTYTYDGLNRLIAVNIGEVEATYSYKADGLRISKTVDNSTTKHIWDGSYICLELDGSDAVIAKYIHGLNLIAAESNGFRLYYLYNAHSDIIQTTDSYGAVVNNYAYDAFGNELNPDPNDSNPFRFCAEYFDHETGYYYLRARFYDPSIGRFISEDPVRSGLNWYTYANNNPVMFIDPTGLFFGKIINAVKSVATASVNIATTAVNTVVNTVATVTTAAVNTTKAVVSNVVETTKTVVNNVVETAKDITNTVAEAVNVIGDWVGDHWVELAIGAAFIVGGAAITALTGGAGGPFVAAFGSALLSSAIQVGAGMAIGVGINGIVNVASGDAFFDNVGDTLASSFMVGGIVSGGSQVLSGGFKVAADMGMQTGSKGGIPLFDTGAKILSPNSIQHWETGGTLIKFGNAMRIDVGSQTLLHAHTALTGTAHIPLGVLLTGLSSTLMGETP